MMKCSNKDCRKRKNINPISKLCPTCVEITPKLQSNNIPSDLSDISSFQLTYNELLSSNSEPKYLIDMYGMLMIMVMKQKENEQLKDTVRDLTNRKLAIKTIYQINLESSLKI